MERACARPATGHEIRQHREPAGELTPPSLTLPIKGNNSNNSNNGNNSSNNKSEKSDGNYILLPSSRR